MQRKRITKSSIIWTAIFICVGVIAVTMLFKQQSFASWKEEEEGIQYENENGELAKGFVEIEGNIYYFDEKGYLCTGKFFDKDSQQYYYADKKGVIKTGVVKLKKGFYITDDNGAIKTGFVEYDGKRYFFDGSADLVKGWFKSDENWYYADDSGVVMTGFITVDGYRYYLNTNGSRVSDTIMEIEGTTYVFNKDGSVDENATTMYPVYQYLVDKRNQAGGKEAFEMDSKVQACAVLRASDLQNGYGSTEDDMTLENLLKNRGVKCAGGYEYSYGGIEGYDITKLLADMEKDSNLQQALEDAAVKRVGLGLHKEKNVYYYDIIFIYEE